MQLQEVSIWACGKRMVVGFVCFQAGKTELCGSQIRTRLGSASDVACLHELLCSGLTSVGVGRYPQLLGLSFCVEIPGYKKLRIELEQTAKGQDLFGHSNSMIGFYFE